MTRVKFQGGENLATTYTGVVDGYVQVAHHYADHPNIWAVVIDDRTGVFVCLPVYKIRAIQVAKEPDAPSAPGQV